MDWVGDRVEVRVVETVQLGDSDCDVDASCEDVSDWEAESVEESVGVSDGAWEELNEGVCEEVAVDDMDAVNEPLRVATCVNVGVRVLECV